MPKWTIVLLIIIVAAIFRFQNITSAPPGLYPDEAMNGNNALQAIDTGDYKVFYPENNGREGLFINIQVLSLKGFRAWHDSSLAAILEWDDYKPFTPEPWMLRIP